MGDYFLCVGGGTGGVLFQCLEAILVFLFFVFREELKKTSTALAVCFVYRRCVSSSDFSYLRLISFSLFIFSCMLLTTKSQLVLLGIFSSAEFLPPNFLDFDVDYTCRLLIDFAFEFTQGSALIMYCSNTQTRKS